MSPDPCDVKTGLLVGGGDCPGRCDSPCQCGCPYDGETIPTCACAWQNTTVLQGHHGEIRAQTLRKVKKGNAWERRRVKERLDEENVREKRMGGGSQRRPRDQEGGEDGCFGGEKMNTVWLVL
ncbi:hypothetical protein BC826DRAFT_17255 [Russula brevipes]|nr:hypothetical protein BC826DRAFT_17255 [Russula brevipes]